MLLRRIFFKNSLTANDVKPAPNLLLKKHLSKNINIVNLQQQVKNQNTHHCACVGSIFYFSDLYV